MLLAYGMSTLPHKRGSVLVAVSTHRVRVSWLQSCWRVSEGKFKLDWMILHEFRSFRLYDECLSVSGNVSTKNEDALDWQRARRAGLRPCNLCFRERLALAGCRTVSRETEEGARWWPCAGGRRAFPGASWEPSPAPFSRQIAVLQRLAAPAA